MSQFLQLIEKYGFALALLFCFGFITPDLSIKQGLILDDSYATGDGGPKSNTVKQVFWIGLFLFFSCRVVINNIIEQHQLSQILKVLALCTLAIISAFWSDYPFLTLKRGIFQFIFCFTVMISFYYAIRHNTLENILFYSGILILLMVLLSLLLGVGFNSGWKLTGFLPGKNVFGQNLLVYIILIAFYLKVHNKSSNKLVFLGGIFFLLLCMTTSKTSIALLMMFVFFGLLIPVFNRFILGVMFFVLSFIFIFIPSLSFYNGDIIHIGQFIPLDAITGRGIIWSTLYDDLSFFQKINFGYGYSSYFNTGVTPVFFDDAWSFLNRITSTHNGYIDILMQFGFYGGIVLLSIVFFLSKKSNNSWLTSSLIIIVIYNFTEASFFKDNTMMWFMALVVFSYIATSFNRSRNG